MCEETPSRRKHGTRSGGAGSGVVKRWCVGWIERCACLAVELFTVQGIAIMQRVIRAGDLSMAIALHPLTSTLP